MKFSFPKSSTARFAYVWYVTNQNYFCSAIVSMISIKKIRKASRRKFPFKVDYLLVHAKEDIDDFISQKLLKVWKKLGGKTRELISLKSYLHIGYYQGVYQKFFSFILTEYERVIITDADGLILKNLDHLFLLELPKNVSLAAPQGYWFENNGVTDKNKDACGKFGGKLSLKSPGKS